MDLNSDFKGVGGVVYKTHTPDPPLNLSTQVKVVYVFGDPKEAVISIHKNLNYRRAYAYLKSDQWVNHDAIFCSDLMRLEENFNNWYQPQGFPFVTVRYDAIYEKETIGELEEFLGARISLPQRIVRNSKFDGHEKAEQIQETYGALASKIANADPVRVWQSK